MASIIDAVGQGIQLEADPVGFFRAREARAQQEAQRQAQATATAPLLDQIGANPAQKQAILSLPPDQQLQTIGALNTQQQFGLAKERESRVAKQAEQQLESRNEYNRLLQSGQRLQQRGLDLRNAQLGQQIQDKAERKSAINDASEIYKQAIAGLSPVDQVKANAALASAKAKGDFRTVDQLLKPEKPKPGTPSHFFQSASSGEVNIQDPNAVENYFKSSIKDPKQAKAAAANFRSAYFTQPEKLGFFESFYKSAQPAQLNAAGQARAQGQVPPPQTPQAPAPGPDDKIQIIRDGQPGTISRKFLKPTDKIVQ